MKISRSVTLWIHFIFDQCVPPILRDMKWFMYIPFKLVFGKKSNLIFQFKQKLNDLSDHDLLEIYKQTKDISIFQRDTDLNKKCIIEIQKNIIGKSVLDIACGRAYLSNLLSENYTVSASDFVISPEIKKKYKQIQFHEADITNLPFKDKQFDTVICAHTLEHVKEIKRAIHELRRVTANRLIIIIPKQRPYKYTFDLHIHFFPYIYSFLQVVGKTEYHQECKIIGGDLFYTEDFLVNSRG